MGKDDVMRSVSQRRATTTAMVRSWTSERQVPAHSSGVSTARDLSDTAALLIATGHLDEQTRTIVLARRRAGRPFPGIGGFGKLRRLADEHADLVHRLAAARSKPAQLLVKYRVGEAERKLSELRAAFVMSRTHYASGVLAIRRERKAGLHLDLDQRGALFWALQRTPVPLRIAPDYSEQLRSAAREAAAEGVRWLAERTPVTGLTRGGANAANEAADERSGTWKGDRGATASPARFADQFETLLFLAGALFDRIYGSVSWNSDYFAVQRTQLDLASELVQIAVDTVALQSISRELHEALLSARDSGARQHIRTRQSALDGVWDELIGRVAALMRIDDALTVVEERLRSYAAVRRAENLDHRIDDLLSRSGSRELSAANIHNVSEQVSGVDEVIASYQQLLYGDIAELTGRDH